MKRMPAPGPAAWCCIATSSFDPVLEVFLSSLRAHLPDAPVVVFRPDRAVASPRLEKMARFEPLDVEFRAPPGGPAPTPAEIAMAGKPFAIATMLDRGFGRVFYADADLWMVARPDGLLEAMGRADILLTPHLVAPHRIPDDIRLELVVLTAGTFNAGLVGVADSDAGRRFCAWWGARTFTFGSRVDGFASDQSWLNLAPGCFPEATVLADGGVNLGHWRIAGHEEVGDASGRAAWRGEPVSILHMSGFDPEAPERLSRHRPGLPAPPGSALRRLTDRYAELVLRARAGHGV